MRARFLTKIRIKLYRNECSTMNYTLFNVSGRKPFRNRMKIAEQMFKTTKLWFFYFESKAKLSWHGLRISLCLQKDSEKVRWRNEKNSRLKEEIESFANFGINMEMMQYWVASKTSEISFLYLLPYKSRSHEKISRGSSTVCQHTLVKFGIIKRNLAQNITGCCCSQLKFPRIASRLLWLCSGSL